MEEAKKKEDTGKVDDGHIDGKEIKLVGEDDGHILVEQANLVARLELETGEVVFDEGELKFDEDGYMMFSGVAGKYYVKRACLSRRILDDGDEDGYTARSQVECGSSSEAGNVDVDGEEGSREPGVETLTCSKLGDLGTALKSLVEWGGGYIVEEVIGDVQDSKTGKVEVDEEELIYDEHGYIVHERSRGPTCLVSRNCNRGRKVLFAHPGVF